MKVIKTVLGDAGDSTQDLINAEHALDHWAPQLITVFSVSVGLQKL